MKEKIKIAVLDDYQEVAYRFADWTVVKDFADVTVFTDHEGDPDWLVRRLRPFEAICVMRERTPLAFETMSQLPNLKLIVSTGKRNASIDTAAAKALGIEVQFTGYVESGAPEITWALLMAMAKKLPAENANMRSNGWQTTIGTDLYGKTIGIIGLGRVGKKIAAYAKAFDMQVIAWSENLTAERAGEAGAQLVSKAELFQKSDFVTIHLVLSERSKHTVTAAELALMKPGAYFINTSRGPLVDESALIAVLKENRIAGAALDVYNVEPLPGGHPFRNLPNVLATPHIGYVTEETYRVFYEDTVSALAAWLGIAP